MQIFLMWNRGGRHGWDLDPAQVELRLKQIFAPLFKIRQPVSQIIQNRAAVLVRLELPVEGWRPAYFQEDDATWAMAVDYPCDAALAMRERNLPAGDGLGILPSLCREVERDPSGMLRALAPRLFPGLGRQAKG